ncbi:MAG: beta-eliminating lyase-related protein [Pseudomonadota bacterium]
MWFGSDNNAGMAPEVLAALGRVNEGWTPAYGADDVTKRAADMIRERFEAPDAAVYFVATGTAANSLALACLSPAWGGIYCHQAAHIEVDECHAPEFYTGGAKLVHVEGDHGRMTPETLSSRMAKTPHGDVHCTQHGALSITNATEAGTIYRPDDLKALTAIARDAGIGVHLDGTRFFYACAATGLSPAEMSWKAGVDILCLGASKNGGLAAEAVIIFDPAKAWEFELRRKRAGHLFSKMRFLSAQFEAMMTGDLWRTLAQTGIDRAAYLAEGLRRIDHVGFVDPVEINLIFVTMPRAAHKAARAAGAYYALVGDLDDPDDEALTCRFVCSHQTTEAEIDAFLKVVA